MSKLHTLGVQFPPSYDRPFLRYFDGDNGAPGGTPTPTPPAPPAGDATPPAGDDAPWKAEDFDSERAWRKIQAQRADLEAEKAKRAQAIKDAETAAEKRAAEKAYKEIGKTLGVVKDDDTPTVESLTTALQERDTNLTSTQAALAAQRAENAVLRYAGKHNGDSDALLDSRDFEKKLAGIDSAADDYATQVEALVKAEVESNSRYRKVQVAPKSSDGDTPPAGGTPAGEKSIDDIRKDRQKRRGVEL
ncbi:hypothetical protein AB0230_07035 [Microbacterium sp. NPDC089190]|uniref:hypothetical protein n=1 Tax=Microbacterium sp. NPDC089190 TaxID=3155063 RepID=UPI00344BB2EA